MDIILPVLGIILFLVGLGLIFGRSWVFFVLDLFGLFSGSSPHGGYVHEEKDSYKGSKNNYVRLVGFLLLVVGLIFFVYGVSMIPL